MKAMNEYYKTGSFRIYTLQNMVIFLALILGVSFFISKSYLIAFGVIGFSAVIYLFNKMVLNPSLGLDALLVSSFLISGVTRIINLPFGLIIDGVVFVLWLVLFFKAKGTVNWKEKNNALTYALGIWALYCVLQFFNPLASSALAWFYAVRGLALNAILIVPLVFLLKNDLKHSTNFITVWFAFSIFLGLYGAKQFWLGVFGFEQAWLDGGGHVTHVLWGRFTRMFSFLSDANQFGCSQAHAGIVATILAMGVASFWRKVFYWTTAAICFYGMFISGTRGAIVIPAASFAVYLALSKNFKSIAAGSFVAGLAMYLLVFTNVGSSMEPVRRMRTAFNATEDASFNVRLENRAMLDAYISDKPFGGGIGSAGVWGQRFSPNNFLAHFETDGHYVRILAETGTVGLYLYYLLFAVIIGKMLWIAWSLKNPLLKNMMSAFTAGLIGMMVANYSAAVTIGLPTSVAVYFAMAFVFMAPKWELKMEKEEVEVSEITL